MKRIVIFLLFFGVFFFSAPGVHATILDGRTSHGTLLQPPPPNIGKGIVPNTEPNDNGLSPTYDSSVDRNVLTRQGNSASATKNTGNVMVWFFVIIILLVVLSPLLWIYLKRKRDIAKE